MPFVRIDKSSVGASNAGAVEIRMGSKLKDEHGPRGVYIAVSGPIIQELGWAVQTEDDRRWMRVYVHEGTGDDAGFWMIEQTDDRHGYVMGSQGKHASYTMGISTSRLKHYVLNENSIDPAPVEYSIDATNKTILIGCPDWLRYNPLSEPKMEETAMVVAVTVPTEIKALQPNREQRRRAAKVIANRLR